MLGLVLRVWRSGPGESGVLAFWGLDVLGSWHFGGVSGGSLGLASWDSFGLVGSLDPLGLGASYWVLGYKVFGVLRALGLFGYFEYELKKSAKRHTDRQMERSRHTENAIFNNGINTI